MINNYNIYYTISIKETYSTSCKISLTIKKCYHSCKGCTIDLNSIIDINFHYCINCKEENNYFPYSDKINNCYNETEMTEKFTEWYFDESKKIFIKCHPNCDTCEELGNSTNMKCLSCSENKIKYKQNCLDIYDNETKRFHNPNNYNEIVIF